MWFCGSEMTAAWFCDTCTTVKPWKVMTVSDTAGRDDRAFSQTPEGMRTFLHTSTHALVRARPPVAEREARIASRFREQLRHATMIDKTNLSGRDLLANPVRGDLVHAQGKTDISASSNQRAKAASRSLRPSLRSPYPPCQRESCYVPPETSKPFTHQRPR